VLDDTTFELGELPDDARSEITAPAWDARAARRPERLDSDRMSGTYTDTDAAGHGDSWRLDAPDPRAPRLEA